VTDRDVLNTIISLILKNRKAPYFVPFFRAAAAKKNLSLAVFDELILHAKYGLKPSFVLFLATEYKNISLKFRKKLKNVAELKKMMAEIIEIGKLLEELK
jgi:hypothetical protein